MTAVETTPRTGTEGVAETQARLSQDLRRLVRVATFIAILTSPSVFYWFHTHEGMSVARSLVLTFFCCVAFRGIVDVLMRRAIPWPSLFGSTDKRLREEDVVNRRRAWTWSSFIRLIRRYVVLFLFVVTVVWFFRWVLGRDGTWLGLVQSFWDRVSGMGDPAMLQQLLVLPILFLANFLIFMGPLLLMGISQIKGFEPGDSEWGVKLEDVRGQAEAKEEIRRVVTLWQSGEFFERSGGKRERGLLFYGAPGTGKTMLAKAIATSFNSPFVSIPGSGFAQTFIGIDAVIVRFLARKSKKLATKWGGTCIVFIDEIDAVGMRRASLGGGGGGGTMTPPDGLMQPGFYGPYGALNPSGDLICETRAWREWLFHQRAPEPRMPYPGWYQRFANIVNQGIFPGLGGQGGGLALNQLLVTMDGIDNPPFMKRLVRGKINTFLDAVYIIPLRVGKISLRFPKARPSGAQIYFIGATNVPLGNLDPALTRPGRMGRHVHFRTPTKDDRKDIFDLYLEKVAHEPDLDTPERRDEIARITNGYSPAMIEQICSMALTNAHHEGKQQFGWEHLVDAMTVIESGSAVNVTYIEEDARSVAVHEAGHAAAAHVYRPDLESSRLSIKMRGGSLGHHQSFEKEERFGYFQSVYEGDLVHAVGAMAAETVFFGQNSDGVGGDLQSTTWKAAIMVGAAGMAPQPIDLRGKRFADETEDETRRRVVKRLEDIGLRLMNRLSGPGDPVAGVMTDPRKRAYAGQFIGQAFVTAYNLIRINKDKVEAVADAVMEQKEIYGDDLVRLLDAQNFVKPEIDWTDPVSWPPLAWYEEDQHKARPDRSSAPMNGPMMSPNPNGPTNGGF
jgi:ATP-dependent Zn protease